jgi:hypothetical protein
MSKNVTCKLCDIADNTGFDEPSDLDPEIHEGFTVGKGKTMYWYYVWSGRGNAYIYRLDGSELVRRWVPGDVEVTIHFK